MTPYLMTVTRTMNKLDSPRPVVFIDERAFPCLDWARGSRGPHGTLGVADRIVEEALRWNTTEGYPSDPSAWARENITELGGRLELPDPHATTIEVRPTSAQSLALELAAMRDGDVPDALEALCEAFNEAKLFGPEPRLSRRMGG